MMRSAVESYLIFLNYFILSNLGVLMGNSLGKLKTIRQFQKFTNTKIWKALYTLRCHGNRELGSTVL